jgi:topoisomerase-4 subunit B
VQERVNAVSALKGNSEITRFKGLGEISPDEFKFFIGDNIKLDPVMIDKTTTIDDLLQFYMGKNTQNRQDFIINNLKVELDIANIDS